MNNASIELTYHGVYSQNVSIASFLVPSFSLKRLGVLVQPDSGKGHIWEPPDTSWREQQDTNWEALLRAQHLSEPRNNLT
jgi:hypothetical protein